MGLINSILGIGGDDDEDEFMLDEEFEEEFEDIDEFEEEDEEEELQQEWENAYEFCKDALENMYGFSGIDEFVAKAMVYRINNSERYRDRIAIGRETMEMLDETARMANTLGGGGSTNWEQAAEQLEGARRVKEEMDKMVDKEEMMLNDMMGLVRDGIDVFKERSVSSGSSSDVRTGIRESEEDL